MNLNNSENEDILTENLNELNELNEYKNVDEINDLDDDLNEINDLDEFKELEKVKEIEKQKELEKLEKLTENKEENKLIKPKANLKTKDDLILHIKEYIKIEKNINSLKKELKEKNEVKKILSANLIEVMKNNNIDCFDINGGSLVYKKSKTKKAISTKFLISELEKVFKEQPNFAKELGEKLLNAREEKINETIKIKINK